MKEDYVVRKVKDICFKGSSQIAQKDLNGVSGIYPIYGASGLIKNIPYNIKIINKGYSSTFFSLILHQFGRNTDCN